MDRKEGSDLNDHQDLVTGRTGFECAANVAAGSFGIQICTGSIHCNANQLDVFARQYATGPRVVGHLKALIDPDRIPFANRGQCRVSHGPASSGWLLSVFACCAAKTSESPPPYCAAAPPPKSITNSRRFIEPSRMTSHRRLKPSTLRWDGEVKASFDHFVRGGSKRERDFEAKRFCGLEIDHGQEFGGLLDRKIGRIGNGLSRGPTTRGRRASISSRTCSRVFLTRKCRGAISSCRNARSPAESRFPLLRNSFRTQTDLCEVAFQRASRSSRR